MLTGRLMGSAVCVVAGGLWGSPSFAEVADCLPFGYGASNPDSGQAASLGKVNDLSPRVNFIKGGTSQKNCPSTAASCRDKAYLVAGDEVIITGTRDDFVCVSYASSKGRVTAGWMPQAAFTPVPEQTNIRTEDWFGTWRSGTEQKIVLGQAPLEEVVTIKGDAIWGASDPDRVESGGINTGSLEGEVAVKGNNLFFAMDSDGMAAYDQVADTDCKVRMRRLGPYMLVNDNNMCGGNNVSFTGLYRRP